MRRFALPMDEARSEAPALTGEAIRGLPVEGDGVNALTSTVQQPSMKKQVIGLMMNKLNR